jgi:hypothetical protein
MTITNGYCTLAQFKAAKQITTTDATRDAYIEELIERISRAIDAYTAKHWYARTETRYYDLPEDNTLIIPEGDLLSITTFTNGDTTTIASNQYKLKPYNQLQKSYIVLKDSSTVTWEADSNDDDQGVISIAGTFGMVNRGATDDPSKEIIRQTEQVCLVWSVMQFNNRYGANTTASEITDGGVVISANDLPSAERAILDRLKML